MQTNGSTRLEKLRTRQPKGIVNVKKNENGCLEYQGCLLPNGYSKIGRSGKTYLGHRLAWLLSGKDIPEGMCVLHKCDNRRCVNVEHLFLGSKFDNMQDMLSKGRHRTNPNSGELNHLSKLKEMDVWKIVRMRGNGVSRKEIAKTIGISVSAVDHVIYGQTWKNIVLSARKSNATD